MPFSKLNAVTLDELPVEQAAWAQALRLWALMKKMGRLPHEAVAEKLGSRPAASHLDLLMSEIGAAWPDPFCVSPPCSPRLSHDEETLVAMIAAAARADRPGFERLLADLLPAPQREHLYICTRVLSRAMRV